MQQLLSNYRTMFLFRGIAAVLFGVIALVWPKMTLSALVFVFGVFAVISGITAVAAALRNTELPGWGFLLFEGILGILAGTVTLAWPGITALAFIYLLAFWAILTGILEVVAPLSFPMSGGRAALSVLTGFLLAGGRRAGPAGRPCRAVAGRPAGRERGCGPGGR